MVIRDPYLQNQAKASAQERQPQSFLPSPILAAPTDRLAATVIDIFIILLPLLMLLTSPFQKQLNRARLLGSEAETLFFLLALVITVGILLIAYQTFFIWKWGATPGKMFFGLRVQNVWYPVNPQFTQSLARSFFWLVESLFLGLAHIAILSDRNRRPIHDRIAETIVVSKNAGTAEPSPYEKAVVNGVTAALALFFVLLSVSVTKKFVTSWKSHQGVIQILEAKGQLCPEIGRAQTFWSGQSDGVGNRLTIAMALYAAGDISEECLEQESSLAFQIKDQLDLAYLANSFVYANYPDLSNGYLKKVCEVNKDSDNCKMSEIVELWGQENWGEIEQKFATIDFSRFSYPNIWAIRFFMNRGQFTTALDLIDGASGNSRVSNFFAEQRAKAYSGLGLKEQSHAAAAIAFDTLEPSRVKALSTWLCYEASHDCSSFESVSCRQFLDTVAQDSLDGLSTRAGLTLMNYFSCNNISFDLLSKRNITEDVRRLARAISSAKEGLVSDAESLAFNESVDSQVKFEAQLYLVKNARRSTAVEKVYSYWLSQPVTHEWVKLGAELATFYLNESDNEKAYDISSLIIDEGRANNEVAKLQTISAFKLDRREEAWRLLQKLSGRGERSPASSDPFTSIKEALNQEYGGK